jgi:hypothetical protein
MYAELEVEVQKIICNDGCKAGRYAPPAVASDSSRLVLEPFRRRHTIVASSPIAILLSMA